MAKYRLEAEYAVDDGPWEPYHSTRETTERKPPTNHQATGKVKDHVALVQTGHDLTRVKARNVRVTNLEQ